MSSSLPSSIMKGQPTSRTSTVARVATPTRPPASKLAKRSKVEIIKENSDFLRHPLMQELVDEKSFISEDAVQLMKFHGSYQQDHREKRAFGQGKFYQFMMRTRQPGGVVSNQLYLAMDDLADQVCTTCTPSRRDSQSLMCCRRIRCTSLSVLNSSSGSCAAGLYYPIGNKARYVACSSETERCASQLGKRISSTVF